MIRRRLAALATAALLLAGLSACAGGSPAPGGSGAATATAPELRLGYFPNLTHAPALIGVQDGLFAKALGTTKLTTQTFNAGPEATEALLSGGLDATFIGPGPTVNAFAQSKAVRVIAGTAANGASLVVKPSITSVAQLKGKTLATPQLANTQDIALRYYLQRQGLKTTAAGGGDVGITPQSNGDTVNAFKQDQLDGAWVPEPYATQLVQAGGKVLVEEKTLWPDQRFVATNLIVRQEFLDRYPGSVTDLLQGLIAAEQRIAADPAKARTEANTALERITGTPIDDAVLTTAWDNVEFTVDPVAASLVEGAKHAEAVGLLEQGTDLDGLYALDPLNALLKADGQDEVAGP